MFNNLIPFLKFVALFAFIFCCLAFFLCCSIYVDKNDLKAIKYCPNCGIDLISKVGVFIEK